MQYTPAKGNTGGNSGGNNPVKLPLELEYRKLAIENLKNGNESYNNSQNYEDKEKGYNLYVQGIETLTKLLKIEGQKNIDNSSLIRSMKNTIADSIKNAKQMKEVLAKMKKGDKFGSDIITPFNENPDFINLQIPEKFYNQHGSNWQYPDDASGNNNNLQNNVPMKDPEEQLLEEINNIRQNPRYVIPFFETKMSYFQNNVICDPSKPQGVVTHEGPAAWVDCIRFLQTVHKFDKLKEVSGMSQAARDHARDLANTGIINHIGSDNSTLEARFARYGNWMGEMTECIYVGEADPKEVLSSLFVDDGQTYRRHRGLLLSKDFNHIGVAQVPSRFCTTITVITLAKQFTNYKDI